MAALPQVGKSIKQTISNDSFEPDSRKLWIQSLHLGPVQFIQTSYN